MMKAKERTLESLGFPIGSRVVMVGGDPTGCIKAGEIGTVCYYREFSDGCNIGVEWEESSGSKHNCDGYCKSKHGRYVPHTSIRLLDLDLGNFEMSDQDFDFLLGINT